MLVGVVQWLALLTHSKKFIRSNPGLDQLRALEFGYSVFLG